MGFFRLLGMLLVSVSLVFLGYEMYTKQDRQSLSDKRLVNLWTLAMANVPQLAQFDKHFRDNVHFITLFIMYSLLSAPMAAICRWCMFWVLPAYGLYLSIFLNHFLFPSEEKTPGDFRPDTVTFRALAVFGGLLWHTCTKH